MGADDTRRRDADHQPASTASANARDAAPLRDEGTPETDAATAPDVVQAAPDTAGGAGIAAAAVADSGVAAVRDEGHPAAQAPAAEHETRTPDEYRREAAAHNARAGAADRATDRILDHDRHQGYIGRADQQIDRAGEERVAGQRDSAHAAQAERLGLERESLDLLREARQLEKAGDTAGAGALREQADAKIAAASDKLDQALDHLDKAFEHESVINDRRMGQYLAGYCEQGATTLEMWEAPTQNAAAVKDAAAQALHVMGSVLERDGPRGLANAISDLVTRARAELSKRL